MPTPIQVTTTERVERLGIANVQWRNRPDDERYLTIDALHDACEARKGISTEKVRALEYLSARPDGSEVLIFDKANPSGGARMTHHAFNQMAQRAKAPAAYLRKLPAELAATNLAWSLDNAERTDGKLLIVKDQASPTPMLRCVSGPGYGRIWDAEVTALIKRYCGPDSGWQVPAASYQASDPKRATTLYASDRDMFAFLVQPNNPIEVPNEPGHIMYRGVIVGNSETCLSTLFFMSFLYDTVCDNRNIWGARNVTHISVRHTSGAPERFVREVMPAFSNYIESSPADELQAIKRAQDKTIGTTQAEATTFLKDKGFSGKAITDTLTYAATVPGNPLSLWNVQQGLTAIARAIPYTDDRVAFEKDAGSLMAAAF